MKETQEVKELRGKILGMEIELCLISKDLERFKNELTYNNIMLLRIQENIDFLKTSSVVVSLKEFRLIQQQKKLVQGRVKFYKTKIKPLEQVLYRKEGFHREEMERFQKIYRLQFENNILEFPHDRRNRKEA